MIYKSFLGNQVSLLGLGNMRLPTVGGRGPIDEIKAREIIEYAYDHGVNYFDTAYRYLNGESEPFVGNVLKQFPRDSYYLATKMPGHMMHYKDGKLGFQGYLSDLTVSSPADIFEDQLSRCCVDYFDYYLLHNMNESSYGFYTDEDLRIVDYLLEQKKAGRIRRLGFSTHGSPETIENFLNWKDCFEFAQIQLNYLDWTLQDAGRKYDILTAHNIPVVVMEPVRGGKLASLNEQSTARLRALRPDASIASWAFRYLQILPNVHVVLSGMSTLEQLQDNLATFAQTDPLQAEEKAALEQVVYDLMHQIPCTACRYCCEECPQGLEIPKLIDVYNEMVNNPSAARQRLSTTDPAEDPSRCVACGACQRICPQGIDIPSVMEKLTQALAPR